MKTPAIAQLLATVEAYNTAHELSLRSIPALGEDGKPLPNPLLINLYDAATAAAAQLRQAIAAPTLRPPPK